jgi:hypothetical protein
MYFINKLSNTILFGAKKDRKSKKSERSEHSEPQEPEPEVEAVVAAVNEVEIEKEEKLASEHLPHGKCAYTNVC